MQALLVGCIPVMFKAQVLAHEQLFGGAVWDIVPFHKVLPVP